MSIHAARLRNISDGSTTRPGSSNISGNSDFVQSDSIVTGRFTIASPKIFELQHFCASTFSAGFGSPALTGEVEVYAEILIWKLA